MKKSLFYRIYFSVIAVFLICLAVGLVIFSGWLKTYEAAQPENIVETLILKHLEKGDILTLHNEYGLKLSDYETEKGLKSFYESTVKGKKLDYSTSALKPEGADLAYAVTVDGKKLMDVFLKQAENKKYEVLSLEFNKSVYKSFKITAAENVEIKVNGIKVKAEDRKNEELPSLKNELSGKKIINKQIITLNNLLGEPEKVTATSEGKETVLKADNGLYSATQDFPEKAKVSDIASKGASTYASYMFNDSSLANVRKYVDTNTDFYENIRTTIVTFTLNHSGNKIEDLKVTEYHKYSDNLFSCRVSLTNVLKRGAEEYKDYFDKYVYLKTSGDSYKIIDMQNAAGDNK